MKKPPFQEASDFEIIIKLKEYLLLNYEGIFHAVFGAKLVTH